MNGYKNILKSQKVRFAILNMLKFLPDKVMLKLQYRIKIGKKLNLKAPERFTEKLQWYKLNYRADKMTVCADKYRVREYLQEKGLSDIACTLYGCYKSADEIDFDSLPDKFVLKTTNGSGTNVICKDKSKLDIPKIRRELDSWLKRPCYSLGREWAYKNIVPQIVAEEYLEDKNNKFAGINDYKFMCFNGKVYCVVFDCDRFVGHKRAIYDREWNYIDVGTDCEKLPDIIEKPANFERMCEIAETLAVDFPYVRVDLYSLNEKIYFGEMTFYPWTGYVQFTPDEFDITLGKEFVLPEVAR